MDQNSLLQALKSPEAYPHEVGAIEVVETHISWVLLTGPFAYKLKKAVALPFVDFSTLERREVFCRDELKLNRRLAPELYLDVVPIGDQQGQVRVGAKPALEYAVKMKQFDTDATADRLIAASRLSEAHFAGLADSIAAFHASAPVLDSNDQRTSVLTNLDELESLAAERRIRHIGGVTAWVRSESERLENAFAERAANGFVRDCHGDLHLGNLALIGDELVAFDCLEFDSKLRAIDVIDEAAFLVMDLWAHERPDLAFGFLNRYVESTSDHGGLALLRYYCTHRALVRAKVALLGGRRPAEPAAEPAAEPPEAARYLAAARAQAEARTPLMAITCGLSGSGKTTVVRGLSGCLPAVHLRSDVERKRLHGLAADARSGSAVGAGIYDKKASDATYEALAEAAAAALDGGLNVIVDAAFLSSVRRERFRELAAAKDAGFAILGLTAREETLRKRIEERERQRSDASEAGLAVLDRQLETMDPLAGSERHSVLDVDTETRLSLAQLAEQMLNRCRRPRTGR